MIRATRRAVLRTVAAATLPVFGLRHVFAQARAALPIPPLLDSNAGPIALRAQTGRMEFTPGVFSSTAGFNGAYLGPTLRMRRGREAAVSVHNAMAQASTVHWHGLLIPSELDGGPHNEIAPGATWRVRLPVTQPAATLWYHAHPHGATGPQVYSGLAGMLIVDDDEEQALRLPARYGEDDLPIILQDRVIDRSGRMVYPNNPMSVMHGVVGNTLLVNGVREPVAKVRPGLVRLRLLNAANASTFTLAFADGRPLHWIGTDGGLLRAPVMLRSATLAPAQRCDVLVDFSDGRDAVLAVTDSVRSVPVLRFAVGGKGEPARLPSRLADWKTPAREPSARRRELTLTTGMGAMMGGMMGGNGRGDGHGEHGVHGINGMPFDMKRIDQRVRLGDVEIWRVGTTPTAMMEQPHPFHIHGALFEVLTRGGRAAPAEDQGRRDTIMVDEPVELLVHFTQPAPRMPFMYHCHILEHEDHGMMGQFTVS